MKRIPGAGGRTARVCCGIVFALFAAVFAFLCVCGLLGTSAIDAKDYVREHVLFLQDNAALNLAVLAALLALGVFALLRLGRRAEPKHLRAAKWVLAVWTFSFSLVWSLSVQTVPTADSKYVLAAASQAANGDFSFFADKLRYFQMFPFQLGLVGVYEVFYRVFGAQAVTAMYVLNAVSLAAAYLAVAEITQAVFADRRITLVTIVLLGLCLQPILFSSFLYGNLPGLAAIAWAFVFVVRFLQTGRGRNIPFAALLCALAVLCKPNNWIGVAAVVVALFLSLLQKFRFIKIVCALAVIAAPLLLTNGVRYGYEQRADVDLGGGTPQTAWLVMGLSESERAPGWYNGYTYSVLKEADWDTARAREQIAQGLSLRLDALKSDPSYAADFFYQKALSQWNEPSFESVWSSKARKHANTPPAFVESVYGGALGAALDFGFEHGVQLVYTLAALSFPAVWLARHKRRRLGAAGAADSPPFDPVCAALPPVFVLGGFLYHLLFEAKSYYALTFFVLLLPYAALGLVSLADWFALKRFAKKRAKSPADAPFSCGSEP